MIDHPRIEKGVPPPPRAPRRNWIALLEKMKVGGSFLLKGSEVPGAVHNAAKVLGMQVATRMTDMGGRCWRVA